MKYLIFLSVLVICCTKDNSIPYFKPGELSGIPRRDSVARAYFIQNLAELKERPLRATEKGRYAVRLMMDASIICYKYIIRVEHNDSVTTVTIKLGGDCSNKERSGLNSFEMTYSSSSSRMDSLYLAMKSRVASFDFYPGLDDPVDYVTTDGSGYLLEEWNNDKYRAVLGANIEVLDPHLEYRGKKDMRLAIQSIKALVPPGLLIDNLSEVKTWDDLRFSVFKNSNQSSFKN